MHPAAAISRSRKAARCSSVVSPIWSRSSPNSTVDMPGAAASSAPSSRAPWRRT
jgi:hypothetical protein